jgi:Asp-tRNA(Asn)/Glu-tRNA(Gln) amidotransferase A subunit family amidase
MNAVADQDPRPDADRVNYLEMRTVLRMVILKVMYENDIDVFVNPEHTTPPYLLGGPEEPDVKGREAHSCCARFTALLGAPEVEVPAGYVRTVYNPKYELSPDKTEYLEVTGTVKSELPHPMPISMMFWAGPGSDADTIKTASAYEVATHHRVPPPAFGPLSRSSETSGL